MGCDDFLDRFLAGFSLGFAFREKYNTRRVGTARGQIYGRIFLRDFYQEFVGKRGKNSRTVTGVDLRAAGASMIHTTQDMTRVLNDGMASLSLDVRKEAYTAIFLFV